MVDDFKGPDGVDYSPIDLYAKYSVTPEQVRKMVQQTMMLQNPFKEVVHQQQRQLDEQMASISENIESGKRKFAEMQARINAEEMAKALRTSPLVYDKVISALSALCGDPHYNANTSEDTMNDFVRSIIAASLEVRDQTRNGISGTSTSATQERSGELDIQIRYNGKPICVYEGLKLDSVKKKELYEHIVKATINYNPRGVKNVFVTGKNFVKDYFKYPCCYSNNRNFLMVSRISVFAAVKAANMLPCSPPRITLIFLLAFAFTQNWE